MSSQGQDTGGGICGTSPCLWTGTLCILQKHGHGHWGPMRSPQQWPNLLQSTSPGRVRLQYISSHPGRTWLHLLVHGRWGQRQTTPSWHPLGPHAPQRSHGDTVAVHWQQGRFVERTAQIHHLCSLKTLVKHWDTGRMRYTSMSMVTPREKGRWEHTCAPSMLK